MIAIAIGAIVLAFGLEGGAWVTTPGTAPGPDDPPPAAEAPAKPVDDVKPSDGDDQVAGPQYRDRVEVRDRADDMVGIAVSASEGSIGQSDLAHRPLATIGNLAEAVPGLVVTQHSGGGKANQFYVRGFNLDHGTDFAISVDGMPVNMPTHGHGQGYADLNFLIPEVIGRARYRKGPYWADVGDFSSAGGLDIDLADTLPDQLISLTLGSFNDRRGLFADSFSVAKGDLLLAAEGFHDDGPFQRGDDFDGGRAMLRYSRRGATGGMSLTAMGYQGTWLATDQIPRRAVLSGLIDRFGLLDPGPRGASDRLSLSTNLYRTRGAHTDLVSAYWISSDFELFSNATYFLDDPDLGDQLRQRDRRTVLGGSVARSWLGSIASVPVETTAGLQLRYDSIDNAVSHTTELQPFRLVRSDTVAQWGGGPYVEARARVTDWLRVTTGLRIDIFDARVDNSARVENSGRERDHLISPKLSMAFGPWRQTELYLNLGQGLHSNDARGVLTAIDPTSGQRVTAVDPLVRSQGLDLGVRTTVARGLQTTLTLFQLELDSELLFIGDIGSTEANRPSRRRGIEWASFYRVNNQWQFDLDLTLADARFSDPDPAGDRVPGAVGRTLTAGVIWSQEPLAATLRFRQFGDIRLTEDGAVRWSGSSSLDARVTYQLPIASKRLSLALDLFNVLDRQDSDVEYFYASRLPFEPAGGVEDIHFHPLRPRSLRLTLSLRR